jgi:hypothetical protein
VITGNSFYVQTDGLKEFEENPIMIVEFGAKITNLSKKSSKGA